jgi:serine/threonine protein kinase/tetratricopeptide (TPR) repeat protein
MGPLGTGSLVGNRFEIDRPAGSGGMGQVYRARDRYSGEWIALKLLHADKSGTNDPERFDREAQLLSELRHPGIVSYLTHGQTPDGQRFLAMEWLEGQDLGRYLTRGRLPLHDCVTLLRHISEALAVAHQRGVIHRDLKPANLFLPGGSLQAVKILDFGIARRQARVLAMTQTGAVMGSPQYMAPEQARGARDLTPAADIFALGCVLYECLAGQPPFVADHLAAVLVRILFEEPVAIEERRSEVPAVLSTVLRRMLHKDPTQRMADASALRAALATIEESEQRPRGLAPTAAPSGAVLSTFAESDQTLFSVVIAAPTSPAPAESGSGLEPDSPSNQPAELAAMQGVLSALHSLGLQAELLASGALAVAVSQTGSATDQAALAARAALLIKESWPTATVSLATGRGSMQGRLAVGEVVDRAARLLAHPSVGSRSDAAGVWIDELSARLLEGRFAQTPQPGGLLLLSQEKELDASRKLLGQPTPCVGRESELGILDGQLAGSLEDSEARAVLITAPPGTGKSRLRHEFLRRVTQRSEPVTVLLGRGDLATAGAPYGILAQAVRRFCGLGVSELPEARRSQLASHIGRLVAEPDRARVTEFMGELCGVVFPDGGSGRLAAARRDPHLLHEQIRGAFVDWLRAECAHSGVLVLLDDLQWGDTLSVGLIDIALRELRAAPLCIVGLARPEVRETFPRLWPGHKFQEIRLKGLSRKACERLVQHVLGKQVQPEVLARIIEQSTGNALFLEELIRAAGEGQSDGQPETVLAMLQARIGRFDAGPRRAVRAASVFGQTFWKGGLEVLLGLPASSPQVDDWLRALVAAEVIEAHEESRLTHEKEYGFRHALVREAAYSLLTEQDLTTGHQLAAQYLQRLGEPEPLVLAEHYRRGGEPESAIALYRQAAEEANRMLALPEARQHFGQAKLVLDRLVDSPAHQRLKVDILLRQVQLGLVSEPPEQNLARLAEARATLNALSPSGEMDVADQQRSGWIDLLSGRIYYYQGQHVQAIRYYRQVLVVAEALGDARLLAVPSQFIGMALAVQGQIAKSRRMIARAVTLADHLDSDYERLRAISMHGAVLVMAGRYREGMALHDQALARAVENKQPAGLGLALIMRVSSLHCSGDYQGLLDSAQLALQHLQKSGDQIYAAFALSVIGWAHSYLGHPQEALSYRSQGQRLTQELGGRIIFSDWLTAADAEIALRTGDAERAILLAEQCVPHFQKEERIYALGLAEQVWGLALGRRNPLQTAEADAHLVTGLALMEATEQVLPAARLRLEWADLCRRRGSVEQAAALRAQAVAQLEASGCSHTLEAVERAYWFGR